MPNAFLRACSVAILVAASAVPLAPASAAAPKRTFLCGDEQGSLVVTVNSQTKITVTVDLGGEDGKFTMSMKKSGSGFRFINGEYAVKISNDQNSLTYSAPDYGTIGCAWSGH